MSDWKRRVKHVLGWLLYRTGLYRRWIGDRALIVLFHRVDGDVPDNPITCRPEEFDAYCRFFARYFGVVPLTELLDRLERGSSVAGLMAITFDDGYLDNREIAAPILRTHGLPACFFIATGFIGTSRVPWWDEEWGITPQWMTWSDVRELVEAGFEVGAHTVNHPDLGKTHGDEAVTEIRESRQTLEREVGLPVPTFCCPFGRKEQITEENREVVKRLGFRCCLSADGGSVHTGSDPFDLQRVAVSPWYVSPYHFGWDALFSNDSHRGQRSVPDAFR